MPLASGGSFYAEGMNRKNPLVRVFISPRFQLWLNLGALVAAVVLTVLAPIMGLLDSVPYVSWLSQLALIYGGLSGVSASLVYLDAKTGETLNAADWRRIEAFVESRR